MHRSSRPAGPQDADKISNAAFLVAAYCSFFVWLAHSYAVRAFLESLHLLSKLLVKR